MLALVPYLQDTGGGSAVSVPVEQVARDFGVDRQTIVNDLNVLWFCGLPEAVTGDMIDVDMEALESEGVVRLDNADYLRRPLRLTAREALALIVALRTLRETVDPGAADAVDRALAKLESAAGDGAAAADQVEVLNAAPVDPPVRAASAAGADRAPAGAPALPGAVTRRDHRAGRRPDAAVHRRGTHLPGGLVPPR